MDLKIQVTIKNVFGNETIYPFCERAKTFAALVGQKTLTRRDLDMIKRLGFSIEPVMTPVVL